MNDDRPEALLKSALEKIVYFEARSSQLERELEGSRTEAHRLRADLGAAGQREIELRRLVAELEVRVTRAHGEREDTARVAEALRRERAQLIGKMLEASRIHGSNLPDRDDTFDLASFISELRGEVLERRTWGNQPLNAGATMEVAPETLVAPKRTETIASETPVEVEAAAPSEVTKLAHTLRAQGRLDVQPEELRALTHAEAFPGRTEETLFGFSVRELAAPDASARIRACERLTALNHSAAAPALATALHGETDPKVQEALLAAFCKFAKTEGVAVVIPLLTSKSPDVRIGALKALMAMDATEGSGQLAAAMKDPDSTVRRRASMLALALTGDAAQKLGEQAITDTDAEVRSLGALVLGASNAERARPLLLEAMCDDAIKVRRAASQSLSRLLGQDVTGLVNLEGAQRRRVVRQLGAQPSAPVLAKAGLPPAMVAAARPSVSSLVAPRAPLDSARGERVEGRGERVEVARAVVAPVTVVPERSRGPSSPAAALAPAPARTATIDVDTVAAVLSELRTSIRGKNLAELAQGVSRSPDETMHACRYLEAKGQVLRRGMKFFVA